MPSTLTSAALALCFMLLPVLSYGQPAQAAFVPLDASTPLAFHNARGLWVDYRGRPALKLALGKAMSVTRTRR